MGFRKQVTQYRKDKKGSSRVIAGCETRRSTVLNRTRVRFQGKIQVTDDMMDYSIYKASLETLQ